MALVEDRNDLGAKTGQLTSAFGAATLLKDLLGDDPAVTSRRLGDAFLVATRTGLRRAFLSATSDTATATHILNQFDNAAKDHSASERKFTGRVRAVGSKLSLMFHLRTARELQIIRRFKETAEAVVALSPAFGKMIVKLAGQDTSPPATPARAPALRR